MRTSIAAARTGSAFLAFFKPERDAEGCAGVSGRA
jgi:hypothetical protein